MYLVDTLSRAYPKDTVPHATPQSKFCHAIEELDLTEHLAIMKERWQQMREPRPKPTSANAGSPTRLATQVTCIHES